MLVPPPWSIDEANAACFIVRDKSGGKSKKCPIRGMNMSDDEGPICMVEAAIGKDLSIKRVKQCLTQIFLTSLSRIANRFFRSRDHVELLCWHQPIFREYPLKVS